MMLNRLDTLATAAGGRLLCGPPETPIKGLFSDTRAPLRGGLFVALRGDNFDGNKFAREAVEKGGAAAVMIERPEAAQSLPKGTGAILVDDSRTGLLGIAARHREVLTSPLWFGVTGSVGKSSTKEMLAHILEHAGKLNVHKAKASFNNAIGLSHTILGATAEHQAVVLEIGTNHPGEIRQLSFSAKPNVAVLTCAAESHLEAFRTVKNVALEKADIFAFQNETDVAILNADDAHFEMWKSMVRSRVITFGYSETADMRAKHVRVNAHGCGEFMARFGDEVAECHLQIAGVHQVANALAAMAAASAAGVPLVAAARALSTFTGVSRRFAIKEARGITFIDDAYNANPASFNAALETLKTFSGRRKFIVAGDMLELGLKAADYHKELGKKFVECEPAGVVTVGALAALAGACAVETVQVPKWIACNRPEDAAQSLKPLLGEGDVVLVKGSHGMHLEKCLELLIAG
ncbi:MAG TPA: UDP-N-acetylmuramoyl-tripeptide--D-alanyl-D-alanine ligase [Planctomycetota bacterium]|nr:UDP-N-acetylmuramoyl-tripeptide--D-alanyl-D-alanine ligase [Planctomycetota bacterium]